MQLLERFIVDKKTDMLCPYFTQTGLIYTFLLRNAKKLLVKKSPLKVIEDSLLFYGDSYQAVKENACQLLGKKTIVPIVINAKKPIYLFPTHSESKACNMWFSLDAIQVSEPFGKDFTKVTFYDGTSQLIQVSHSLFASRYGDTCYYKELRERRIMCNPFKLSNVQTTFKIDVDVKSDTCTIFENAKKITVHT